MVSPPPVRLPANEGNRFITVCLAFLCSLLPSFAQDLNKPVLACSKVTGQIRVDGVLSEADWHTSDSITRFTMVEPAEKQSPSYPVVVRVLADPKNIYIGIICYDNEPEKIVAFSKARDSELDNEDYIKIVLDPYLDGRNGFIFAVNPFGARYDAIVSGNGEHENNNWDGIWEARTSVENDAWSVEVRIPVNTLTFRKGLPGWGFNVERRIQRLLEVDRWTSISRDYKMGQTLHAGVLTGLPDFTLGIGLTPRAATIGKVSRFRDEKTVYAWDNSLDLLQKITPDITAQATLNTDFAETEVDSRRTNLTRFPILYPEKRQFFLEGADIYDFGLGLGRDFMPFFSRRIGLYEGNEIPVRWGGKLNGKLRNTHFGALVNQTAAFDTLIPRATLGVVRIKQNILKESSFGVITSFGDPAGREGSWSSGADFTLQTSTFRGNKNLMAGIWGLINNREDLTGVNSGDTTGDSSGERTAFGLKIDYPNDLWDISFVYQRIGDAFDPSLGFVPRKDINNYSLGCSYMPRPEGKLIRQHMIQTRFSLYTDLENHWESYDLFTAPVHFLLESGDRFEFNIRPVGEYLREPFEISDSVIIPEGGYHWMRYRLEVETASKRRLNGQVTWWFGGFYGGRLDQIELELNWRPTSVLILELSWERNTGSLPAGNFTQELYAGRLQLNMTPNLNFSTYIQYDNESQSLGSYSRLRWTFAPMGDLFIVYKHNVQNDITDRWLYESNQLIVKLTYGFSL